MKTICGSSIPAAMNVHEAKGVSDHLLLGAVMALLDLPADESFEVVAVPRGSPPPTMFGERVEAWEALAKSATPVTVGDQERKTLELELVSELDR